MKLQELHEMEPWDWPEGAGPLFLAILNNRQAELKERLLAAEMAGDFVVIDDQIAEALLAIVCSSDEDERLRDRAVISLGPALEHADTFEFDDPEYIVLSKEVFHTIQAALRKLYLDPKVPKNVRRRILEASIRAPQEWHHAAVRAAYACDDQDWRLTAVFCMRFLEGFDKQILAALDSKDEDIHYEAVCAAGSWGLEEAWPHIEDLLTNRNIDKELLLAALEAAAGIRHPDSAEIIGRFVDSEDEDIADVAFEALSMANEDYFDEDDDSKGDEYSF